MAKQRTILFLISILLPVVAGAQDDIVLDNGNVKIAFSGSRKEYSLMSFVASGVELVPDGGSNVPPWMMTFLGPRGENPTLQPKYTYYCGGSLSDDGHSASFVWDLVFEGSRWPLTVTVALDDGDEMPRWSIDADIPEDWTVTELEFPRIPLRRLEGDVKGILPVGYGVEYGMPASGHLQMRYPSCTGGMELVMMHNGKSTIYFAAEDYSASNKYLGMAGDGQTVIFYQKVPASYAWSDKGKFSLPWKTVVGYNPENWDATALKWYRPFVLKAKWGLENIRERNIAKWIKNADMWLRPVDASASTMNSLREALAFFGKGIGLHWYSWQNHPFDTNYPDYFPEQPGFADMVKEAQRLGAYVTPYINGRLWDTANHTYEELNGSDASCRKPDGSLYTEVYSSKVINTVTCPSTEIWQNVIRGLNRRILNELGTDGVYMDQIGCAASEPCYAKNHPHAPGGGDWWPAAYRHLLTSMRQDLYGRNQAMTTEENVECYIDLFDMMLVVNSPHRSYQKMVPLFPLIYSDRCIYSGFTYVPWTVNNGSFSYITMKSLLWGSQLGWISPELIMRPENRSEASFLRNLFEFRRKQHDIFLGGRFLSEFVPGGDNPVVVIPNYQETNVVMGANWESVDGKTVMILVNMSEDSHVVTLPDGGEIMMAAYSAKRIEK